MFWSRGGEGKFHIVGDGMRVIEAPFAVASERTVRKEDVTAVYVKMKMEVYRMCGRILGKNKFKLEPSPRIELRNIK